MINITITVCYRLDSLLNITNKRTTLTMAKLTKLTVNININNQQHGNRNNFDLSVKSLKIITESQEPIMLKSKEDKSIIRHNIIIPYNAKPFRIKK